jgi:hypothetical protein
MSIAKVRLFFLPSETKAPFGAFGLFLSFFVLGLCATPFTPFFKLDFTLYKLLVFATPIVDAGAFGAREFYELIL